MNASYNYFLSERIALAACKAIDKNPETPLEKENLVKLQHGNISKENAQKNINTLKKLDILDETGLPTDLGRNWANEITKKMQPTSLCKHLSPAEQFRHLPFLATISLHG